MTLYPPPQPKISMVGGEKVVVRAGCTLVASCFSLEVGWAGVNFPVVVGCVSITAHFQPHRLLKGGSRVHRLCVFVLKHAT